MSVSLIRRLVVLSLTIGLFAACAKDKGGGSTNTTPAPNFNRGMIPPPWQPSAPAGAILQRENALREAEAAAAREHGSGTGNAVEHETISPLDESILEDAILNRNYIGTAKSACHGYPDLRSRDASLVGFVIRCGIMPVFSGPNPNMGMPGQNQAIQDLTLDQYTRLEFIFDNSGKLGVVIRDNGIDFRTQKPVRYSFKFEPSQEVAANRRAGGNEKGLVRLISVLPFDAYANTANGTSLKITVRDGRNKKKKADDDSGQFRVLAKMTPDKTKIESLKIPGTLKIDVKIDSFDSQQGEVLKVQRLIGPAVLK